MTSAMSRGNTVGVASEQVAQWLILGTISDSARSQPNIREVSKITRAFI